MSTSTKAVAFVPPPNEWCPVFADITVAISISLSLLTLFLMYMFWKNRSTPAFKARRPTMTMIVSGVVIISMILPIMAAYNICNYGPIQDTLNYNVSAGGIHLYGLWLITYRTWILYINWKMATTQLKTVKNEQKTYPKLDTTKNVWWFIYKYFATKIAVRFWYFILTIWILLFTLCADVQFYFKEGFNGPWALTIILSFYALISFILVMFGRNMKDHFKLMTEMKIYVSFTVILTIMFMIVSEHLPEWAPQYTPPQIVQIKIVLNIFRSGLSVLLFMGIPLIKFRFSIHGILLDRNLTEMTALSSDLSSSNTINSRNRPKISKQEQNLADFVEANQTSDVDTPDSMDGHHDLSAFVVSGMNVNAKKYPSLYAFLSKNRACYQAFKIHLASCLALENILFYTEAQMFRNQLKAKDRSSDNGATKTKESANSMRGYILGLDLSYLQSNGGLDIDTAGIKEKWCNIYGKYISSTSPFQINVDYMKREKLEAFNIDIEVNEISVEQYIESFEDVIVEIWRLMDNLYVHFQVTPEYKEMIKQEFVRYKKKNKNGKDTKIEMNKI